jgi:hypothetical protein
MQGIDAGIEIFAHGGEFAVFPRKPVYAIFLA